MGSRFRNEHSQSGDGASPGKIFIGGLHKDTTNAEFNNHFGKYGEITDSVIMRDRHTGQPRGFGFITYADPSVVDKVIEDDHIFNGKQVEIKRTIPKGAGGNQSKDFKTKKIFVGGIPSTVTEDELRDFFAKYGNVMEHQIIRDHETNRSRGFGFVIFDSEEVVDELLTKGNMIDMADTQVEIKKAEPKKSSNRSPPSLGSHPRVRSFNDSYGGYAGPYGGFDGGYGPIRSHGGLTSRYAGPYGYGRGGSGGGSAEFGGRYGGYGGGSLGGYRNEAPVGYSSRFGSYGGGFGGEGYGGGGYIGGGGYGGGGGGGYGRGGEGFGGGYGGTGYGGAFESGPGSSYEGTGGPYGRGGYSSSSRYHPYGR